MSDTLSGTTHPDDNNSHPWWGLPCTVTPCFGACLVQEGNWLHYLADRAGIRVSEALRDLAFWLYRQLENEYDRLTSDAAVDEALLINEYTFTEAGLRAG